MARRILYKNNSLIVGSGSTPPVGYKFVGYFGATYSQIDSDGIILPIGPLYGSYIAEPSVSSALENPFNWTGGNYTGPNITGTFQDQKHYDGTYFYTAVADNLWIRFARV